MARRGADVLYGSMNPPVHVFRARIGCGFAPAEDESAFMDSAHRIVRRTPIVPAIIEVYV